MSYKLIQNRTRFNEEQAAIQPWHAGANFLNELRSNQYVDNHMKKVQICMFCGNVADAKKSFKEFKKFKDLKYSITDKNGAPWHLHTIVDTPTHFKKFLDLEEETFKDGNVTSKR